MSLITHAKSYPKKHTVAHVKNSLKKMVIKSLMKLSKVKHQNSSALLSDFALQMKFVSIKKNEQA